MSDVTQILNAIEQGDPSAAGQLLPLVYAELRRLAAAQLGLLATRYADLPAGEVASVLCSIACMWREVEDLSKRYATPEEAGIKQIHFYRTEWDGETLTLTTTKVDADTP